MKIIARFLILIVLFAASVCSQDKPENPEQAQLRGRSGISVRYIGNEGVLISADGKQILIDGLHREYRPAYAFPPADLLALLESASAPYDKIDLLLVSHVHLDHFHSQSVASHLQYNPRCLLLSSEQVVDEIAKDPEGFEKIRLQIGEIGSEWKKSVEMNQKGIKVKFLGLRHANEQHKSVQNLGHLIDVGGRKILHIGDADMTAENFSAFELQNQNIDIAFVPYWFLISEAGRRLVKEQFDPKQIIAVHIPPAEAESVAKQIKEYYPNAVSFTQILDEKIF